MDSTENEKAYIKYLEKQIKALKKQLRRSFLREKNILNRRVELLNHQISCVCDALHKLSPYHRCLE
jgi:hypothetical protein